MKAAAIVLSAGLLLIALEAVSLGQPRYCSSAQQQICYGGCYNIGSETCYDAFGVAQTYTNVAGNGFTLGKCFPGGPVTCTEFNKTCVQALHNCGYPPTCTCPAFTQVCTNPPRGYLGCDL